jgi:urease accessory protein
MLEIKAKLKIARTAYKVEVKDRLALPFEARAAGTLRTQLASGEEVALNLPHGEVLRGGDLVTASDGRVVEVVATPEKLFHIEAEGLAKIAYHLGSQHIPVQVGPDFLRVPAVPELQDMMKKLGGKVSTVEAPFEPEQVDAGGHADHGHGHVHDEHCGHDHHGHAHQHHQYESK